MNMIARSIVIIGLLTCLVFFTAGISSYKTQNHPPKVEFLEPSNGSTFNWNNFIPYSIRVTDEEDGSSEYDEINAKEIFLEVNYFPSILKADDARIKAIKGKKDAPGLAIIKSSVCFNCHAYKTTATGPSFLAVAKKYPNTAASVNMLSNKIIKGSSGVWTSAVMPANPNFTVTQSKQIAQWILSNAQVNNKDLLQGATGNIKTFKASAGNKGTYILKASYRDHGVNDSSNTRLAGEKTLLLYNE